MSVRLTERQQEAVQFGDGALLVLAGPGSGKTRILTERIRRILAEQKGHFRILAITFTNKAANEMRERLGDVRDVEKRAFLGTLHSFCLEVLSNRGQAMGIEGLPYIFQAYQDRLQLLREAVRLDPVLERELVRVGDQRERQNRLRSWLEKIHAIKSSPESFDPETEDWLAVRLLQVYDNALRSNGGVDYDDLLLLTYRLFRARPKIAGFYRRLYHYVFIDEGQDLNEAQYCVIRELCGEGFRNVMMVGDPNQAIFGYNTADPKYMERFEDDFSAVRMTIHENFRCSRAVLDVARRLEPSYKLEGTLPLSGAVELLVGENEGEEARLVVEKLLNLVRNGHRDVEESSSLERFAILGRTRFALLQVEEALRAQNVRYFRHVSSSHESTSVLIADFEKSLNLLVNPTSGLHQTHLIRRWSSQPTLPPKGKRDIEYGLYVLRAIAEGASERNAAVIMAAVKALELPKGRLDFLAALKVLQEATERYSDEKKRAAWEDIEVWRDEWDRYLRAQRGGNHQLDMFLSNVALGTTQQPNREGVALLTVHSAKGMEFDVVFLMGMCEGTFPDYRAKSKKQLSEETRSAFVAVTRARRLLYLSYPKVKRMPWGEDWSQKPSQYINLMDL